jgi:hypothetical protein
MSEIRTRRMWFPLPVNRRPSRGAVKARRSDGDTRPATSHDDVDETPGHEDDLAGRA